MRKPMKLKIWFAAFALSGVASLMDVRPVGAKDNPNKVILGVYTGNESANYFQFEKWLGKPADAVLGYTGGESWEGADPGWQIGMAQYLGGTGRPVLWSIPMTPDKGGAAAMREAATGSRNSLYESWATKILKSRAGDSGPIYVRTTWELGGEWFPWTQAAKDDPKAYIGAFRQFAASFHKISSRFKIVWDFTGDRGPIEQWYPGDMAVDVISQDVYWNPQWTSNDAVVAFDKAVNGMSRGLAWMTRFAEQHKKPMAISEWGVPAGKGTKFDSATYINLMTQWIKTHDVLYATYWNSEAAYDGKLSDNDPTSAAIDLKKFYLAGIKPPKSQSTASRNSR